MAIGDGTRLPHHLLFLLPLLIVVGSRRAMAQPSPPSTDAMNGDYFAPTSFNPSVAILIVVLVSAFFFLGFFSIYIRRCGGDPFGGGGGGVSLRAGVSALGGVMARSRRQRGLDPAVLETFPTLAFAEVKELRVGKGSLECAVCLSEFEDDETLRLLPTCSHAFHPDCIDAWLASHVTCPVCRCNLVPDPAAPPSPPSDPAPDSTGAEDAAEPTPLAREGEGEVVIDVADGEREEETRKQEAIELQRIGSQRQALRVRSGRRPARLPRSHSTGHSLTTTPAPAMVAVPEPEGNPDRYTLRLPEHIRREIVAAGRLKRTRSLLAFPSGGEESSRRGYRGGGGGGEGSSRGGRSVRLGRSERWPSFFTRTFSARVPAWASGRRSVEGSVKKGEGEGSTRGKLAAAVAPFDCFVGGGAASPSKGGAGEEDDESSTAALARRV